MRRVRCSRSRDSSMMGGTHRMICSQGTGMGVLEIVRRDG
jgi:hypothetical protein